ncbi:hypothetical protein [Maribacter polysaccharolyticus]|uniref:hypothetical protein n=1 Tax=Maribacter polysaccharolyticus TaxID=3020831 RepID=UPI00237F0846|nr:hypothetical protein [Maribacter polysaccharolyticus]MDE3742972.1 hypothetical protein [Maribacter polysaccharolyticus]
MDIKPALLFAFSLLIYTTMTAQTDIPNSTPLEIGVMTTPDNNNNTSQGAALNIPSIIDLKPNVNLKDSLSTVPINMNLDNGMLQAGHDLKLDTKIGRSEKQGGSKEKFGDQYLGDIKNNGKFVGIVCRDHEYVDGDRVKISLNGRVIDYNVLLTANFKGVNIDLEKGFNRLDFEALNEGSSSPNTAQVAVYDDEGNLIYSNRWLLSQGSKATLIITKE